MTTDLNTEIYLRAFLNKNPTEEIIFDEKILEKLESALERAHDIRKFEIDLYWKRSNFFWLLQTISFAGITSLWKTPEKNLFFDYLSWLKGAQQPNLLVIFIVFVGFATSITSLMAAIGSKRWQRNWERHVDIIEKLLDKNLYRIVFKYKKGPEISVSSLNENISKLFIATWLALAAYFFYQNWNFFVTDQINILILTFIIIFSIFSIILLVSNSYDSMHGDLVPMDTQGGSKTKYFLIRKI